MTEIKKPLKRKTSKDISKKKWIRHCNHCHKEISYSTEWRYLNAIRLSIDRCIQSCNVNVINNSFVPSKILNGKLKWIRPCPQCNAEILHNTIKLCRTAVKLKRTCSICYHKNKIGSKATSEAKANISKGIIKAMEEGRRVRCNRWHNSLACVWLDALSIDTGWNIQHAMNGGELRIGKYWIDGYDSKRNIIIEYDEHQHFANVKENILTLHDIQRQTYIRERFSGEFYRYNEGINKLTKVK
jgi:hypothetical protein